jgi:hypothetical protein
VQLVLMLVFILPRRIAVTNQAITTLVAEVGADYDDWRWNGADQINSRNDFAD